MTQRGTQTKLITHTSWEVEGRATLILPEVVAACRAAASWDAVMFGPPIFPRDLLSCLQIKQNVHWQWTLYATLNKFFIFSVHSLSTWALKIGFKYLISLARINCCMYCVCQNATLTVPTFSFFWDYLFLNKYHFYKWKVKGSNVQPNCKLHLNNCTIYSQACYLIFSFLPCEPKYSLLPVPLHQCHHHHQTSDPWNTSHFLKT